MICLSCGETLTKNKKYCNNICQKNFQYLRYIEEWKNNKVNGMKGDYQISNHIRRYLLEKYDNKCSMCGWNKMNPFTKSIPLEIEHKDGNYLNNSENNLQLLCPNCHSLTQTYKGANRNNGRKARKKYDLCGNPELSCETECRDFIR